MNPLKSLNLYAVIGLVAIGGVIAQGLVMLGEINERNRNAAEMAKVNIPLAELRGKDEAEVPAEAKEGEMADAVVAGALKQQCILTEETANLMASIR